MYFCKVTSWMIKFYLILLYFLGYHVIILQTPKFLLLFRGMYWGRHIVRGFLKMLQSLKQTKVEKRDAIGRKNIKGILLWSLLLLFPFQDRGSPKVTNMSRIGWIFQVYNLTLWFFNSHLCPFHQSELIIDKKKITNIFRI